MSIDNILSSLRSIADNVQETVETVVDAVDEILSPTVKKADPEQEEPKEPEFSPAGYVPKLGDVVKLKHQDGDQDRGRVVSRLESPRRVSIHLGSGMRTTSRYWDQIELIEDIGFLPTLDYVPQTGDRVRTLDSKGLVVEGRVEAIHHAYRSVKVNIGQDPSPRRITVPWNTIGLLERPAPESEQSYEDLKAYYEERLKLVQSDAQQVSQQHRNFLKAVGERLGLPEEDRTERDVLLRLSQIGGDFQAYVRKARRDLESALRLWENP